MADDKRARDKQARDADNRQRMRDVVAQQTRADETEPAVETETLDEITTVIDSVDFPATGSDILASLDETALDTADGSFDLEALLPDSDAERFDTPASVRRRVRRPVVAAAMKRVVAAVETLPHTQLRGSQRDAYERTFRELESIAYDDDDEVVQTISDWIVDRIHEDETLPGSRAVRRQAATVCRASGHEVSNDEWLGV